MTFLLHQTIAGPFINVPGGVQDRLRPQSDLLITGLSRETGAFVHKAITDAKSTGRRFNQQQTQARDFLGFANQENGAGDATVFLCDPAALTLGVELLDELSRDL